MMRWVDDPKNPHGRTLVCTGADIDEAMERHYLKFFNGSCDMSRPALDVEKFVGETLRKDGIEYDPEAEDLPRDVLGVTKFNPDGTRLIRISAKLYKARETALERGRFRFTCAHEAFHAIFHAPLFNNRSGRSVCLERNIREDIVDPSQAPGDFIEWQANRGAAALLMPHSLFIEKAKQLRVAGRNVSIDLLARGLAGKFDVSRQSALIRLQTLGLMASQAQDFEPENDGIDSYRDQRERKWS